MSGDDDLDLSDLDDLDFDRNDGPEMGGRGTPKWAHHGCGARWRNRKSYGHCTVCHKTFTSDEGHSSAFAKHRVGSYEKGHRCLTTEQMLATGNFTVAPGDLFDGQPTADLWTWKKASA